MILFIRLFFVVIVIVSKVTKALERPDLILEKSSQFYYLLYDDNTYCQIEDDYTLNTLGYKKDDSKTIDDISLNYRPNKKFDCPISLSKYKGQDECTCLYLISYDVTNILTNNVSYIENITNIGNFFNPFLLPNKNHFLMTRRTNSHHRPITIEVMSHDFKSVHQLIYYASKPLIRNEEDIRLYRKPNGNILMQISTYHSLKYYVYTAARELAYNKDLKFFIVSDPILLYYPKLIDPEHLGFKFSIYEDPATYKYPSDMKIHGKDKWRSKNWMPFTYNNRLYFVTNMFPTEVVSYPDIGDVHNTTFVGETYKASYVYMIQEVIVCKDTANLDYLSTLEMWLRGDVRGSTPLTLVPNVGYFGFFHTKFTYCHYLYKIYYMGAFVLSAKPPFQIIKMTTFPIQAKELLFDPKNGPGRQSVIFPMSFYFLDENKNMMNDQNITSKPDKIILSAGYNDYYGLIITLDFDKIINSMSYLSC